jgi:hypothetical protein
MRIKNKEFTRGGIKIIKMTKGQSIMYCGLTIIAKFRIYERKVLN